MASAQPASAAVSARSVSGPRLTGTNPATRAACPSSAVSPPSGPHSMVSAVSRGGRARSGGSPSLSSSQPAPLCVPEASSASRLAQTRRAGGNCRSHCLHASTAMRAQRSCVRGAASSACGSVDCWAVKTCSSATPSSVAFCTSHSRALSLMLASPRRTTRSGRAGIGAGPCTRTWALPRSACTTSAQKRSPRGSWSAKRSPARMRRDWSRCRASSPSRRTVAPSLSSPGARK